MSQKMAIHDTGVRAMLAVMDQQRPTIRSVAAEIDRGTTTTYRWLLRLRDMGLIDWDDDKAGTMRANYRPVSPPT